jgi:rod shape-determining protein MreD
MTIDLLKRLGWFMVFLFVQVMVLGRIHLFGVATALLYVYFILQTTPNYPKWGSLLWAFFLGLFIDIFSNTPGLAAASLTAVAAVQPYWLKIFLTQDASDHFVPSFRTLGPVKYIHYSLPLVLLFCLLLFTLEQFSFFQAGYWLGCILGSTLLTMALILTFETAKK